MPKYPTLCPTHSSFFVRLNVAILHLGVSTSTGVLDRGAPVDSENLTNNLSQAYLENGTRYDVSYYFHTQEIDYALSTGTEIGDLRMTLNGVMVVKLQLLICLLSAIYLQSDVNVLYFTR